MASRVPAEQPAPLPESRRADAERNVLRIQEAAIRLWAEEPSAGVADVAAAAGVGRATLYRHFPTRESLLEAIRSQGMTDGEQAMEECRLDEGSPTKAIERLLAAWLELGDRYRVVVANPSQPDNYPAREREEAMGAAMQRADRARPGGGGVLAGPSGAMGRVADGRPAGGHDPGRRRGQDPARGRPRVARPVGGRARSVPGDRPGGRRRTR